jgi:hypothetical protein
MIYQMQAEGRFPQRIKLGERAVGWLESEVREWLAARIDASRGGRMVRIENRANLNPTPPVARMAAAMKDANYDRAGAVSEVKNAKGKSV